MTTSTISAVLAAVSLLATAAPLAAQEMYITDCSLGCTSGAAGSQVSCSVLTVHENERLEIGFSLPLDPLSLHSTTVRIIDILNGTVAQGTLRISPLDPRRLIFEPAIFFNGFTLLGFGFERNHVYSIWINGEAQGDPAPYLMSTTGLPNRSRMNCTFAATDGVLPPVQNECTTTANSVGSGAVMGSTGSTYLTQNNLVFEVAGLPSATFGVFVIGADSAFTPLGVGTRCVGGTLWRLGVTPSNSLGETSLPFNAQTVGGGISVVVGSTWHFQHVYRDVVSGAAVINASDALGVTFFP